MPGKGNRKSRPASITVEASFVMPVFLLAAVMFVYLFVLIEANLAIHAQSLELGRIIGAAGSMQRTAEKIKTSVIERSGISDGLAELALSAAEPAAAASAFHGLIERYRSVLSDVSFSGSGLSDDGDCITVVCSYNFRIPIVMFGQIKIPVTQRVKLRLFNGYGRDLISDDENVREDGEADGELVYIADTGSVYHSTQECTHLLLSITSVTAEAVESLRNKNGAKYYSCEKCAGGVKPAALYITREGTRYHYKASCPGLKRTVKAVELSEAEKSYRPCRRCAAGRQNSGGQSGG